MGNGKALCSQAVYVGGLTAWLTVPAQVTPTHLSGRWGETWGHERVREKGRKDRGTGGLGGKQKISRRDVRREKSARAKLEKRVRKE